MVDYLKYTHALFSSIEKEYSKLFITNFPHLYTIIKYHIHPSTILSSHHISTLKQLLTHIHIVWLECCTQIEHISQGLSEDECQPIYMYMLSLWNQLSEAKYSFFEQIKQLPIKRSNYILPNENNKQGTEWYTQLYTQYIKLGGTFPSTPLHVITYFKQEWNRLSDCDTHILYPIFTEILGGVSIEYNAYCLHNWITQNKEVVPNINDWILTSYKSGN